MAGVSGRLSAVVFWFALGVGGVRAQSTPQALASAIAERWSAGSKPEFEALSPFAEGRKTFSALAQRRRGLGDVIRADSETAVILLSGVPAQGNPGEATLMAAGFSGKERDAETGLDYFGARYFSSAQGRRGKTYDRRYGTGPYDLKPR